MTRTIRKDQAAYTIERRDGRWVVIEAAITRRGEVLSASEQAMPSLEAAAKLVAAMLRDNSQALFHSRWKVAQEAVRG